MSFNCLLGCCSLANRSASSSQINTTGKKRPDFHSANYDHLHLPTDMISPLRVLPENLCQMHKLNREFFISDPRYKNFYCTLCLNELNALLNSLPPPFRIDNKLLEKFIFLEFLGQGGYGMVFSIKVPLDMIPMKQEVYALKLVDISKPISNNLNKSLDKLEKLKTEVLKQIGIHSRLMHENIVKYYDYFWIDGGHKLAIKMEKADKSLNDIIKNVKYEEVLPLFLQICYGIQFLHLNNIIHRDLKPQNILIKFDENSRMRVKITDFGDSKLETVFQTMSEWTDFLGTFPYLSPELIEQHKKFSKASDIWALGIIFYQMLSKKKHPFRNHGPLISLEKEKNILSRNILTLHHRKLKNLSRKDEAILSSCLEKNPTQRITIENLILLIESESFGIKAVSQEINNFGFQDAELDPRCESKISYRPLKKREGTCTEKRS